MSEGPQSERLPEYSLYFETAFLKKVAKHCKKLKIFRKLTRCANLCKCAIFQKDQYRDFRSARSNIFQVLLCHGTCWDCPCVPVTEEQRGPVFLCQRNRGASVRHGFFVPSVSGSLIVRSDCRARGSRAPTRSS